MQPRVGETYCPSTNDRKFGPEGRRDREERLQAGRALEAGTVSGHGDPRRPAGMLPAPGGLYSRPGWFRVLPPGSPGSSPLLWPRRSRRKGVQGEEAPSDDSLQWGPRRMQLHVAGGGREGSPAGGQIPHARRGKRPWGRSRMRVEGRGREGGPPGGRSRMRVVGGSRVGGPAGGQIPHAHRGR